MSNAKERLYLFDTTLRDGAQTAGIEFSLEDKIAVTRLLEELGVDYIEGGYPGANVVDDAFFAEPRTKRATFTAFGMTKRSGRSVGNDPGVQAIAQQRRAGGLLCRQDLGQAGRARARHVAGGEPQEPPRDRRGRRSRPARRR